MDFYLQGRTSVLHSRYAIKDLGPSSWLIGFGVSRYAAKGTITLSQEAYVNAMVTRYGLSDAVSHTLPLPEGFRLYPTGDEQSPLCSKSEREIYKSLLGSLLYAAIGTRPDISTAISILGRVQLEPTVAHLRALKGVLLYLKGTASTAITFGGPSSDLTLRGYCDSDYAGSPNEEQRRSTSGYVFTLAGAPISWFSKLQQTTTLSSTEAEYVAITECVREVILLRNILSQLGFPQPSPTSIRCDNNGAMVFAQEHYTSQRAKHIDVRLHWIRQSIAAGVASLSHIPTRDNPADLFTKNLPRDGFGRHRSFLLSPTA